jgi:hypothetical protein
MSSAPNDGDLLAQIGSAVAQYRDAPFRSADWLANEIMGILDGAESERKNKAPTFQ